MDAINVHLSPHPLGAGVTAPEFTLKSTPDQAVSLSEFRGQPVALAFYPADFAGTDFENGLVAQTPLGRAGQPGDIASVAVFLASADSGWITGERIVTSGGL